MSDPHPENPAAESVEPTSRPSGIRLPVILEPDGTFRPVPRPDGEEPPPPGASDNDRPMTLGEARQRGLPLGSLSSALLAMESDPLKLEILAQERAAANVARALHATPARADLTSSMICDPLASIVEQERRFRASLGEGTMRLELERLGAIPARAPRRAEEPRTPDLFADLDAARVRGKAKHTIVEWLRCAAEGKTWGEIAGRSYHVAATPDAGSRKYHQLNGPGGVRHVLEAVREYRDHLVRASRQEREDEPLVAPIKDNDARSPAARELARAILTNEWRMPRSVAELLAVLSGMTAPAKVSARPASRPVTTEGRGMTYKEAAKVIGYPTPAGSPNGAALESAIRRAKPGSALYLLKGASARTSAGHLRAEVVAEVAKHWRAADASERAGIAERKRRVQKARPGVDFKATGAALLNRINKSGSR